MNNGSAYEYYDTGSNINDLYGSESDIQSDYDTDDYITDEYLPTSEEETEDSGEELDPHISTNRMLKRYCPPAAYWLRVKSKGCNHRPGEACQRGYPSTYRYISRREIAHIRPELLEYSS